MAAFDRVVGKKTEALDGDWLLGLAAQFNGVSLDIGTGDGRFVVDSARAAPDRLWIGVDPVAENMADSARTASASPRKGGVANAIFLRGSAEQLPGPLAGIADRITVNYPWGTLMRYVALPDEARLGQIVACGKPMARLTVYLNYSVFQDADYLDRLGLSGAPDPATDPAILDGYVATGCEPPQRRTFAGDPPFRSQWGRQLTRGSDRLSLLIETRLAGAVRAER